MNESKITNEGQITIPVEILRYLGVTSGDKISFTITDYGVVLDQVSRPISIQDLFATYNLSQPYSGEAMQEVNLGEEIGEEKVKIVYSDR